MTRVITMAREFGSGGAEIARELAGRLGWRLVDHEMIDEIARLARVEPKVAERYDEHLDSWMHRIARRSQWFSGVYAAAAVGVDVFDAETEAGLARKIIEEVARVGGCVIVGRGSQCVLQNDASTFHVFIYAPWNERLRRAGARLPAGADVAAKIARMDRGRAAYVREHYGQDWRDTHLYNLLLCSAMGNDRVIRAICAAAGLT